MISSKSCFYSATSTILWGFRVFIYLVVLTLSLAIVGMVGRKDNNVWNTTLPWNHTYVDFCAYGASSISPGESNVGNPHASLLGLTIMESWHVFFSKYWPAEFLLDIFFFWWWLIGAVVVTSQRPSSSISNMLGLTKFIHGIEGLAWCNFSLTFFACVATVVNGYFFIEHCENSKDASDNKQSLAV